VPRVVKDRMRRETRHQVREREPGEIGFFVIAPVRVRTPTLGRF